MSLDPFNWVLEFAEVYASGGFDVVVGNPPWEVLAPNRDEFFSRYDPQFRGKSPEEKTEKQETLLTSDVISEAWGEYRRSFERRADYFSNSGAYNLQKPQIDGKSFLIIKMICLPSLLREFFQYTSRRIRLSTVARKRVQWF